jgi:DNA polymerase-3 subunit beta
MKIQVKQTDLSSGLNIVSAAVRNRVLPVLANVLLAVEDDRLRLYATDLEMSVTCSIEPAHIEKAGSISVPARTFADLVATLPGGKSVSLELDTVRAANNGGTPVRDGSETQTLLVSCGDSRTKIKGIDANEFPPFPEVSGSPSVRVTAAALKKAIRQTAFAASKDESRPILAGVLLEASGDTVRAANTGGTPVRDGNNLTLTAADGYRLSRRQVEANVVLPGAKAVVPVRALNILAKSVSDDAEISIWIAANQVIFAASGVRVAAQVIDGNYPDVTAILGVPTPTTVSVNRDALVAACRQALVVAREGGNALRLRIEPGNGNGDSGKIHLEAEAEGVGRGESHVEGEVTGEAVRLGVNAAFLLDAISCTETAKASIGFGGANTPVRVIDGGLVQVIMPLSVTANPDNPTP